MGSLNPATSHLWQVDTLLWQIVAELFGVFAIQNLE